MHFVYVVQGVLCVAQPFGPLGLVNPLIAATGRDQLVVRVFPVGETGKPQSTGVQRNLRCPKGFIPYIIDGFFRGRSANVNFLFTCSTFLLSGAAKVVEQRRNLLHTYSTLYSTFITRFILRFVFSLIG